MAMIINIIFFKKVNWGINIFVTISINCSAQSSKHDEQLKNQLLGIFWEDQVCKLHPNLHKGF